MEEHEEYEELLVDLIDLQTKKVKKLRRSVDKYKAKLDRAEKKLQHFKSKLARIRRQTVSSEVKKKGTKRKFELTSNAGQGSPKQLSHVFPGRSEPYTNKNADKQYEVDLGRILRGDDKRTMLMIKHVPNKCTSKMLHVAIDEQCQGTYDFLYLPMDFKNKCNFGYGFINMIDPGQIIPFHKAFHGKKWEKFNSEEVAELAYAQIQGKSALIARFQNSSRMNKDKWCGPTLFHTDGPNAGDPVKLSWETDLSGETNRRSKRWMT